MPSLRHTSRLIAGLRAPPLARSPFLPILMLTPFKDIFLLPFDFLFNLRNLGGNKVGRADLLKRVVVKRSGRSTMAASPAQSGHSTTNTAHLLHLTNKSVFSFFDWDSD